MNTVAAPTYEVFAALLNAEFRVDAAFDCGITNKGYGHVRVTEETDAGI